MQHISLGDILKARLAGLPAVQLDLDLRHVCPLTGVAMSATKQTGKALYWYESGVVIDPKNEGWQRYVRGRYFTDLEAGRHRS